MDESTFGNVPPCPVSLPSAIPRDAPGSPRGFGCPEAPFLLQAAVGAKAFAPAPLVVREVWLFRSRLLPRQALNS